MTQFLAPVDLNLNELRNARLHLLAADPSTPQNGQIWFNTTTNQLAVRCGGNTILLRSDWVASVNVDNSTLENTGTTSAPNLRVKALGITDSHIAAAAGIAFSKLASPTSAFSFNSQKITNLASGTAPGDAVNFAQLEQARQGIRAKAAVEAASTGNVNIANPGTNSFDGVTVAVGEAVLLRAQTTAAENGIYVFNGNSSAMTRRDDADTFQELDGGTEVFVQGGTVYGEKILRQLNELTAFGGQNWQIVGGSGAYVAGTGLTEAPAGTFNLQTTGIAAGTYGRVTVDAFGRATAGAVTKFAANVGDGSATTFTIAHGLGTADVTVSLRRVSDGALVFTTTTVDATNVVLTFATAPTANQYRVVVTS